MIYGDRARLAAAAGEGPVLVRIHSACFTGETMCSHRCDCGEQLQRSLQMVAESGCGVVLYLQQVPRKLFRLLPRPLLPLCRPSYSSQFPTCVFWANLTPFSLAQEGRGIGLVQKLRAYNLQDTGLDTVDANVALGEPEDGRNYLDAAAMLRALGVSRVRLITNNPDKVGQLGAAGVEVV